MYVYIYICIHVCIHIDLRKKPHILVSNHEGQARCNDLHASHVVCSSLLCISRVSFLRRRRQFPQVVFCRSFSSDFLQVFFKVIFCRSF